MGGGEDDVRAQLDKRPEGFRSSVEAHGPEYACEEFLDFRNGPGSWEGYSDRTRDNFLNRTQGHIANLKANMKNQTPASALATITVPTLAIKSEEATSFDGRMVEIVAEAMPNGKLITVPDTAHMLPRTHPDLVAEIVLKHLAG